MSPELQTPASPGTQLVPDPVTGHGGQGRTAAPIDRPEVAPQRPPLLDSAQILQGHAAVEIHHQGMLYRLQATRQGKLILTK